MASIKLQFEGASVDLTKGKLLDQLETAVSPDRIFTLPTVAAGTFAELENDSTVLDLTLDQNGSWKIPGQANLNFGLSSTVSFSIRLLKSGELFRFRLNDEDPDTVVRVDGTAAYVSLIFDGSFEVTGGAKFSGPNGFGVSADASAGSSFVWEMHRAFPFDTLIRDAIVSTFEDVVLPFQSAGLDTLRTQDFVRWGFVGKIHAGVGADWGIDKVLFSGNSPAEVVASIRNQKLATLTVTSKPEIKAQVSLAVTYDHTDSFGVILHRTPSDLSLLLFSEDKSDLAVALSASAKFDPGTTLNFNTALDSVVKDKLLGNVDFPGKDQVVKTLQDKINSIDGKQQVQKLITDTNNLISQLKQSIELKIQGDRIHRNTALFNYHFDVSKTGAIPNGYNLAMQGDFVGALAVDGVSLDPGTLLENDFIRQTSLSFHLFDVFQFTDVQQYFEKTKLIYTGNQALRFQLESDIGFHDAGGVAGHASDVEVYFSAVVSTDNLETVSNADVRLNVKLLNQANKTKSLQTAAVLGNMGATATTAAAQLHQLAISDPALDVQVEATIFPSAYGTLRASEYNGDQPGPVPHVRDNANWNVFVDAFNTVMKGSGSGMRFPDIVANFGKFEAMQIAAVDEVGGSGPADRRQRGNPSAIPPSSFGSNQVNLNFMETGRQFLNIVDDLEHLPAATLITTNKQFGNLVDHLKEIARNDIPDTFFARPMLLALLQLMNGTVTATKAPDPQAPVGDEFVFTFEVR